MMPGVLLLKKTTLDQEIPQITPTNTNHPPVFYSHPVQLTNVLMMKTFKHTFEALFSPFGNFNPDHVGLPMLLTAVNYSILERW